MLSGADGEDGLSAGEGILDRVWEWDHIQRRAVGKSRGPYREDTVFCQKRKPDLRGTDLLRNSCYRSLEAPLGHCQKTWLMKGFVL